MRKYNYKTKTGRPRAYPYTHIEDYDPETIKEFGALWLQHKLRSRKYSLDYYYRTGGQK